MSVFSPSTWLSRSRCQSASSADCSKDDTATLRGLVYLSQHSPSLEPSLEQPELRNQQVHNDNCHNYEHKLHNTDGFDHHSLPSPCHDLDISHAYTAAQPHRSTMNKPSQLESERLEHKLTHLNSHHGPELNEVHLNQVLSDDLDDDTSVTDTGEAEAVDTFRKDIDVVPEIHHTRTIQRIPSFGNGSCISGLSADETHYDMDDNKTTKSMDSMRSRTLRKTQTIKRHNQQRMHVRGFSQGRDFGDAFDHIVQAEDLLTDDRLGPHTCDSDRHDVDPFSQMNDQFSGHGHTQSRVLSRGSGNLLLLDATSRPRPLHNRAQSEIHLRPTQLQSSHHSHQRMHSLNVSKHSEKAMPLPAHATLRDVIATKRKQAGDHKFISKSGKPQILQARSTSLTVQSNASTSSIPNSNISTSNLSGSMPIPVPSKGIPVVWSGHQLESLNFGAPSPGRMHNRSRTLGHVHMSSNDLSQPSHSSEYSNGYIPEVPRSHKSTGSSATFFTQSETAGSNSNSNHSFYRQESHVRRISDSESSSAAILCLTLPEDSSSVSQAGKIEDATTVFSAGTNNSRLSGGSRTPRRKGKIAFKDEVKFVLGKFVPSPLKKVGRGRSEVKLERSAGCLT